MTLDWKRDLKRVLAILFAALLLAVSIKTFVRAADLFPGGVTGLTVLIQRLCEKFLGFIPDYTPINLALNAFPVYIGFRYVGKKFTLLSLLLILGADKHHIRHTGMSEKLLRRLIALVRRQAKPLSKAFPPFPDRLGGRHDLHAVKILDIRRIRVHSTAAASDDGNAYVLSHNSINTFRCAESSPRYRAPTPRRGPDRFLFYTVFSGVYA